MDDLKLTPSTQPIRGDDPALKLELQKQIAELQRIVQILYANQKNQNRR